MKNSTVNMEGFGYHHSVFSKDGTEIARVYSAEGTTKEHWTEYLSTNETAAISRIKRQLAEAQERVNELEKEVERLGEMANVCTKSITGNVCATCKCGKKEKE